MYQVITDIEKIEYYHNKFIKKLKSFDHEVIKTMLDSGRGGWEDDVYYIKNSNIWFTHSIGENDTEEGLFFNNFGFGKPQRNKTIKSSERCQICFSFNNSTAGIFAKDTKENNIVLLHNGKLSQIKVEYFFNSFKGNKVLAMDSLKERKYALICSLDSDNKIFINDLSDFIRSVFYIKNMARNERLKNKNS